MKRLDKKKVKQHCGEITERKGSQLEEGKWCNEEPLTTLSKRVVWVKLPQTWDTYSIQKRTRSLYVVRIREKCFSRQYREPNLEETDLALDEIRRLYLRFWVNDKPRMFNVYICMSGKNRQYWCLEGCVELTDEGTAFLRHWRTIILFSFNLK